MAPQFFAVIEIEVKHILFFISPVSQIRSIYKKKQTEEIK